jgi:hypothetical protein
MEGSAGTDMRQQVHVHLSKMGGATKERVAHRVARRVAATGSVTATAVVKTLAVEEVTDAVQRTFE